jgi:hypothetical protein
MARKHSKKQKRIQPSISEVIRDPAWEEELGAMFYAFQDIVEQSKLPFGRNDFAPEEESTQAFLDCLESCLQQPDDEHELASMEASSSERPPLKSRPRPSYAAAGQDMEEDEEEAGSDYEQEGEEDEGEYEYEEDDESDEEE